jgi:chemotaxis protein MotB
MKLLLILALSGCLVPKKKYDALSAELATTKETLSATTSERDAARGQVQSLEQALAAEQAKLAELLKLQETLQGEYDKAHADWDSERANLLKDKTRMRASIEEMESALRELAERRAAAEERVAQYRDLLKRLKQFIDSGALKVKIVDGRMVVEMATDILFASGKAELSEAGEKQLLEVARVLASIPDRHYQVEGHTDNVPIANERFHNNWELASARALVVVSVLVEGGIASERVSGASYAEFHPVASNDTPQGRAANRRIEIVVVPDLAQLPGFEELKKAAGE